MAEQLLRRELRLKLPRDEVFEFFSDAANLERITPRELRFHIVSPQPIEMGKGTLIDYRLRIRGVPVKWQTEISVWNPPFGFEDRQIRGPYKQWIHRHTFTEISRNETLIEDEIRYRLPLEPFGDLARFLVRRELDYIFDFRQKAVADLLGNARRS